MSWIYVQKTGRLLNGPQVIGSGYAGNGQCKNDPASESIKDHGPLPCGGYTIGPAFDHPVKGPLCMRLTPDVINTMFGRDGFMIHGDSIENPGTASDGCIIQSRVVRQAVSTSDDRRLEVIADEGGN